MHTARTIFAVSLLCLTLQACSSSSSTPDPNLAEQPATEIKMTLLGDKPHADFEAFASSVGSIDSREEATLLGAEGEGAAAGYITAGGLVTRDGGTQRVLLAGKAGALYEVAVLDSWSEKPTFMPYAKVTIDGSDLPEGYFQLSYDAGRTQEVDGGTSYEHLGKSLICGPSGERIACAEFIVSKGSYLDPGDGSSSVKLPNAIILGRGGDLVEVIHLETGDEITPAGNYKLVKP